MPSRSAAPSRSPHDMPATDWLEQLLNEQAPLMPVPHVPELLAPACHNLSSLWEATEAAAGKELEHAPFWATPWPGGIVLARWVLDHPGRFARKVILDLGAGSGVSGIAAARVGGRVILNDIDPLALAVAEIAARANGAVVDFLLGELGRGELADYDIIMVADGFYERPRSDRLLRDLEACVSRGITVLAADGGRNIVTLPGTPVLELEVPVKQDMEGRNTRWASVHLLEP